MVCGVMSELGAIVAGVDDFVALVVSDRVCRSRSAFGALEFLADTLLQRLTPDSEAASNRFVCTIH